MAKQPAERRACFKCREPIVGARIPGSASLKQGEVCGPCHRGLVEGIVASAVANGQHTPGGDPPPPTRPPRNAKVPIGPPAPEGSSCCQCGKAGVARCDGCGLVFCGGPCWWGHSRTQRASA